MRHVINFLFATIICFVALTIGNAVTADKSDKQQSHYYVIDSSNPAQVDTVAQIPVIYDAGDHSDYLSASGASAPKVPDLTELLKYLLSTLGGIITSVILAFLRKKFPDWFPESMLRRG